MTALDFDERTTNGTINGSWLLRLGSNANWCGILVLTKFLADSLSTANAGWSVHFDPFRVEPNPLMLTSRRLVERMKGCVNDALRSTYEDAVQAAFLSKPTSYKDISVYDPCTLSAPH